MDWFVFEGVEGQGTAFQAASAMLDRARDTARFATLVSYVDRDNLRSCRFAERLGGGLDPGAPLPQPEDMVYRLNGG